MCGEERRSTRQRVRPPGTRNDAAGLIGCVVIQQGLFELPRLLVRGTDADLKNKRTLLMKGSSDVVQRKSQIV